MTIKKIIRALLKIPLTPVVVSFNLLMIFVCSVSIFYGWLYEDTDMEKSINHELMQDYISNLKKWFTTI
jgi:hypothetical protein